MSDVNFNLIELYSLASRVAAVHSQYTQTRYGLTGGENQFEILKFYEILYILDHQ